MKNNKLGVLKTTGAMNMNEINEEIVLTINLMQTDIDNGAHDELQSHLYSLLEMKRNEIQQRLAERSWADNPAPYKSVKLDGQITDEDKPLTVEEIKAGYWIDDTYNQTPHEMIVELFVQITDEAKPLTEGELRAGGWWCEDVSEECRLAFVVNGIDTRAAKWSSEEHCKYCYMDGSAIVRSYTEHPKTKQIKRIGNEFYWSE